LSDSVLLGSVPLFRLEHSVPALSLSCCIFCFFFWHSSVACVCVHCHSFFSVNSFVFYSVFSSSQSWRWLSVLFAVLCLISCLMWSDFSAISTARQGSVWFVVLFLTYLLTGTCSDTIVCAPSLFHFSFHFCLLFFVLIDSFVYFFLMSTASSHLISSFCMHTPSVSVSVFVTAFPAFVSVY